MKTLMRDRLVVGLKTTLSEGMQLHKDLTLTKYTNMATQSEVIKGQQTGLRVEIVVLEKQLPWMQCMLRKASNKVSSRKREKHTHREKVNRMHLVSKDRKYAPIVGKRLIQCHNFGKRGHYGKVCTSGIAVNAVSEDNSRLFLCTVNAGEDPWAVRIQIRNTNVRFKIDTGADLTVIPEEVYKEITKEDNVDNLTSVNKPLSGPGGA